MPEFCTCGAELPPDARFCHRCGKPQREEVVPEESVTLAPPAIQPPAAPPAAPPRLNFHNATAVRTGLLLASIASLLSALPVWAAGLLGLVVWWLTAGFLSVYVYRRRTGQFLSVDSGLRMGWITGLLGSTISSVLFTVSVVPLIRSGTMTSIYKEQLHNMAASDANVQEALRILQSPSGLTMFVIMALLFLFLIITFLCTAGGALGAKLFGGVAQPRP
jgi:hypothetical protein